MTSDSRYNIQSRSPRQSRPSDIQLSPQDSQQRSRQTIDIRRPTAPPLPQNRPIGDNTTDDMDDMLGYLD